MGALTWCYAAKNGDRSRAGCDRRRHYAALLVLAKL